MTSIVTRSGKGSELTYAELDANQDSLNGINEAVAGTTYTVVAADQNRTLEFTNGSSIAVTLTAISSLLSSGDTSDFKVTLKAVGGGVVTATCGGADVFDTGITTLVVNDGESVTIQSDSTGAIWNVIGESRTVIVYDTNGNEVFEYSPTASALNHIKAANNSTGANPNLIAVAGAGESDIGLGFVDSNANDILKLIVGNSSATEYLSILNGVGTITLRADGATNTNINIVPDGTGELQYNGAEVATTSEVPSVVMTLGTPDATTSGTTAPFTSIPSGTKKITVMLDGVSIDNTGSIELEIGDSGGYETSGYSNASHVIGTATGTANSTGFSMHQSTITAGETLTGVATLTLVDSSTNTWVCQSHTFSGTEGYIQVGSKSLSAELDRVQIIASQTFDAGKVNILYEG